MTALCVQLGRKPTTQVSLAATATEYGHNVGMATDIGGFRLVRWTHCRAVVVVRMFGSWETRIHEFDGEHDMSITELTHVHPQQVERRAIASVASLIKETVSWTRHVRELTCVPPDERAETARCDRPAMAQWRGAVRADGKQDVWPA